MINSVKISQHSEKRPVMLQHRSKSVSFGADKTDKQVDNKTLSLKMPFILAISGLLLALPFVYPKSLQGFKDKLSLVFKEKLMPLVKKFKGNKAEPCIKLTGMR